MNRVSHQRNNSIRQTMLRTRKLLLASQLLWGLLILLTASFGMWLILFVVDNLLHLPAGLRLALSLGGVGLIIFEFWRLLLQPIIRREKLESTTLLLESKFSIPENMLINALCFESAWLSSREEPFAQQTIKTGSAMINGVNVRELWQFKRLSRWLIVFLIVCILWGGYGISRGH